MDEKTDYKTTLNLPKTDFQMKAELSKKEPETLARWEADGLYKKIVEAGKAREKKFILHDGPPYANGNIHIGHALNKILKDIIVKSRFMAGAAVDYVPGWDCHGLPIELQVEKELGAKKKEMTKADVRKRCRAYAEKFISIQREEFKRLGVLGRWEEPYLTMAYGYQASILEEFGRFNEKGLVYKGKKPVHWCSSCRTALAEAEVEYADKTSPSVYVKFKVRDVANSPAAKEGGLFKEFPQLPHYFVIWTTTPWTLPANLAIAVHPDVDYRVIKVKTPWGEEAWCLAGALADACLDKFKMDKGGAKTLGECKGAALEGVVCEHPFINRKSGVLPGGHVTTEAGTGCVHIAPGHGQEDYELGLQYGLEVYNPVDDTGRFTSAVPEFEGKQVFKANPEIVELLNSKGALLLKEEITHSYPHCWRCKSPIIFRATEQWFVSMEAGDLRRNALEAIDNKVEWIPSWGRDRIYNMIEARPDWCLSRQRAWGVPIPALKCASCEKSFLDSGVLKRLVGLFEKDGADVWFEKTVAELVPPGVKCPSCGSSELKKEEDILDVWFDSGVSFAAVLEKRQGLAFPADLYLEGSDQHRGWFHSSLLASMGTRGVPPYRAVLTHGFVVDGAGKKMSKSLGNVVAPQEVFSKYGAEILRLWVAAEDYREDIRISEEILKRLSEAYRRIRNTFRYILGNLYDFDPAADCVPYEKLEEIDRLTLHRLARLTERVRRAYEDSEFHVIYHAVHNFCSVDLSAFYLDVLKDRLYTCPAKSTRRRAGQTTIYRVLDHLVRLTAPVLVFTADEAWSFMPGKREESVHLAAMPEVNAAWLDDALEKKWDDLIKVEGVLSKALEKAREAKLIGHSLDAAVRVPVGDEDWLKGLAAEAGTTLGKAELKKLITDEREALEEMLIVSGVSIDESQADGSETIVTKAPGQKCERCWRYSTGVGADAVHPTLCPRCAEALK